MSDISVELTDPTAELAEAMRARMGITDEGGENEKVEDQKLEDQKPAEKVEEQKLEEQQEPVEDPNHDDANQPVVEGSGGAVPRMGADGGGGGQEAEPPVEVEDVPEFIQFGSIRIPRSQEQELEQLYRWAQEQILAAPVAPPAGQQQQPAPPAEPEVPAFNPEDFVDPDLARVVDERFTQSLDPITQQLDLLLQAEQRREREAFEQHQIVLNAAAEDAKSAFAEKYALTPEQTAALEQATAESGFIAAYSQRTQNPREVFDQALEATFWATPAFREAQVSAAAQRAATEAQEAAQQQAAASQRQAKKSRAGVLAGGSSTITRQLAPPQTKQERREAMIAHLERVAAES
jgi:hypothetical protein